MSRPETIGDLETYERAPHDFVRVDPQYLTRDVKVGAALLALIDAARSAEGFVIDEDGTFTVSIPLSDDEVQKKLSTAQAAWDNNQTKYTEAREVTKLVPPYLRWAVDAWAKKEELPAIDWEAHDLALQDAA